MKAKAMQTVRALEQIFMGLTFAIAFILILMSTMGWMIRQGL